MTPQKILALVFIVAATVATWGYFGAEAAAVAVLWGCALLCILRLVRDE